MLLALIAVFPAVAVIGYTAAFAGADQILWQQRWVLGFVSLAALGAALIGGQVFVLRPIGTLRSSLDRLAAGDLSARAQLAAGAPGLSELGSAVNAMAIALEARQRERDHADEVLRTLSTALEQSPENVIVTDGDGRIEYVNAAFETLTGYSRAEVIGQTPRILKAVGKYKQEFYEKLWETILGGGVFEAVLLNQKKNGDVYSEEKTIASVRDAHGTITHFVSTGKDITERQQATLALKASEAKFHLVMENTPSAIFIHSGNRFVYANMAAERLTGYTRDELLSMPFWQIVHPDLRDLVRDRGLARQGGEDVPSRYELKISTKAGEERWVDITAARTLFDGEWSGLATVFDITQQKETAQALITSEAQLRQSQKMEAVGTLAGGVAHDFNNLLTVIIGNAEFMAEKCRHGGLDHSEITEITGAAQRAADLTRQLLAFSRKQLLQPRVIDLSAVVSDSTKMLRRILGEDIELVVIQAPGLGTVKADPGQMGQVLLNLAVNAREAMPDGGRLTIKLLNREPDAAFTRMHASVSPGAYVMLTVSDTGCGMDAETRARIFEPFFTTKELGKGTGLGLSTVYGIVKQSGGSIWVDSEVGQGTTFDMCLPRVEDKVETPSADGGATHSVVRGTETVLLVEDEGSVRTLAQAVLTRAGYKVLEAGNGTDALDIAKRYSKPIHLLLTDVVMPRMNGPALAGLLSQLHAETRVLYTSGYAADAIVRQGMLETGVDLIKKPFRPSDLARRVRACLDASGSGFAPADFRAPLASLTGR